MHFRAQSSCSVIQQNGQPLDTGIVSWLVNLSRGNEIRNQKKAENK